MSIANLMPGDEIDVELRYSELIVPTDGVYRFVYPTVVGPRYNGAPGRESHQAEPWIAQPTLRAGVAPKATFGMTRRARAPMPVQALTSPSHRFDDRRRAGSAPRRAPRWPAAVEHANRDVVLDYRLAGREIASGVLVHEGQGRELLPRDGRAAGTRCHAAAIVPREYVFILDVSGSMHGFPIETAKTLLRGLVGNLRPTDTFNIIPFAGGHSLLAPRSLPATRENIEAARRFIGGQRGSGSTELLAALRAALALPAEPDRARSFVVITDGYVSIEKEAMDLVRAHLGDANVFAFGIGSSVNRFLIEGLARAGRGEPFIVLNPQQAAVEADRFRTYIEAPLLTRIRVDFRGFDAYDVDPPQLPDLFALRPLVLSGKFRGAPRGSIEISGVTATGAYHRTIDVERSGRLHAAGTRDAVGAQPHRHARGLPETGQRQQRRQGDHRARAALFAADRLHLVHRGRSRRAQHRRRAAHGRPAAAAAGRRHRTRRRRGSEHARTRVRVDGAGGRRSALVDTSPPQGAPRCPLNSTRASVARRRRRCLACCCRSPPTPRADALVAGAAARAGRRSHGRCGCWLRWWSRSGHTGSMSRAG